MDECIGYCTRCMISMEKTFFEMKRRLLGCWVLFGLYAWQMLSDRHNLRCVGSSKMNTNGEEV